LNEVNAGNSNNLSLTSTISSATDLDIVKASARVQELNLQQQALVYIGSSLGKMPLINVVA